MDTENNITLTNKRIRELLNIFNKATYLAYTATPYANIFILPDNKDEMIGDDLFPKILYMHLAHLLTILVQTKFSQRI